MARRPSGQLITRRRKRGVIYAARVPAYGRRHYVTLGSSADGWDRRRAEEEIENILADVRRGIWRPPEDEPEPEAPRPIPTFHAFSTHWFEGRRLEGGRRGSGLSPAGEADLRWRLELHILPWFAGKRLDEILVEDIDRFRRAKVAEGRLNATSINKCLSTLSSILELAVEYEQIAKNPAKGSRRRLPAVKPRRSYLDRADMIAAVLDAAGELDRAGRSRPFRRALLSVLVFAGPRLDEALSLRRRDVDLARGVLRVSGTKTDSANRTVDLLPVLRDELGTWVADQRRCEPGALLFRTASGRKHSQSNIRRRVLDEAVERAKHRAADRTAPNLPERLTPHSLRRTYASILVALGEDPTYLMGQLGHTSSKLSLEVRSRCTGVTASEIG